MKKSDNKFNDNDEEIKEKHNHTHHHCCCHDESEKHDECNEDESDDDDDENSLKKIIFAAVLFIAAILLEKLPFFTLDGAIAKGNRQIFMIIRCISTAMYFAAYLLTGLSVFKEAVENLIHGEWFGEEFLMSVAALGAVFMGEYSEGVAVMLLFQTGEYLEDKAIDHSKKSISQLMKIRSDSANLKTDEGIKTVEAESVKTGSVIVIKPGERVPLDGKIIQGKTMADTSALTGESVPEELLEGDSVLAGFVNLNGVIEVLVEKEFGESSVSRILNMVQSAQSKKTKAEKFIRKFAKYYTPVVVIAALLIAIVPSIIYGGSNAVWHTWIYRALELLVVSCPCAIVISIPLSFFSGIGLASKNGILIKGSNYIEILSRTNVAVFDKTGTLTKGVFEITEVNEVPEKISADELVRIAAHAEYYSEHPVSRSLKSAHSCPDCLKLDVKNAEEISGHGIKCMLDGKTVLAGNLRLLEKENVAVPEKYLSSKGGTVIHIAADGEYLGNILISDVVRDDAQKTVEKLHKAGVSKTVMLTGDGKSAAEKIAGQTGIDEFLSELLPENKVEALEKIISKNKKGTVIFTGDGINDAPVLSRSDAGIAMGALGSDAAIEAADVVIMNDRISSVADAVEISKVTMKNVYENTFFSLGSKIAIIALCALGFGNMWLAVFGDVGVTMIAVLNSMRVLGKKQRNLGKRK